MHILIDFRPFTNNIPSNGDFFCEDLLHAFFRNHPSDIFYIWTSGNEKLTNELKFDTYSNIRRIHTDIQINTLYRLIRFLKYPAIDDLVETLAMKNGHLPWTGQFDIAFFATPMPVLLEGNCFHVHITSHLKALHTPEIFEKNSMQYQKKNWYKKNWNNANLNIVPSKFLADEISNFIDDSEESPIFVSNIGVKQNITRFQNLQNHETEIQNNNLNNLENLNLIELDEQYQKNKKENEYYNSLPEKFFFIIGNINTIEQTIKAFNLFIGRYPDSNMKLLIEEPFNEAFKFLSFLSRSNNITVLPTINYNNKIIILSKCIAFIDHSLYNTEGKNILEAMRSGASIICSSFGALPEICPKENFFFDPSSYHDLLSKLKECYKSYLNKLDNNNSQYQKLSELNIKLSTDSKFSWDNIAIDIMSKILNILEEQESGL
jgi:glycosyltransferase involved in cell wall biosynthesis